MPFSGVFLSSLSAESGVDQSTPLSLVKSRGKKPLSYLSTPDGRARETPPPPPEAIPMDPMRAGKNECLNIPPLYLYFCGRSSFRKAGKQLLLNVGSTRLFLVLLGVFGRRWDVFGRRWDVFGSFIDETKIYRNNVSIFVMFCTGS